MTHSRRSAVCRAHPYSRQNVRNYTGVRGRKLYGRLKRPEIVVLPPIATHFSVAWYVCLSVVCHIHALCLKSLTDLDAIWQVHLWGPVTHCVRWGRRFGVQPRSQIAAATWRIERKRFRLLPSYVGACFPCYTLIVSPSSVYS